MPRSSALPVIGLLWVLSACAQPTSPNPSVAPVTPTEQLDFDTDPRILRGLWTGENTDGQRLLIDANPSDPNELGYAVTGTFQLDDEEPVVFAGGVRADLAGTNATVLPQTSPEYAPFDATSYDGLWQLFGDAPADSPPRFEMILGGVSESYTFTMTAPTPIGLAGTNWTLTTLRGEPVQAGTELTLDFTDQRFDGSSGCNLYGASYLATKTTFEVVYGVLSTAMLCDTPTGVMEQEEAYTRALSEATTYQIAEDRLEMRDDTDTIILAFSR